MKINKTILKVCSKNLLINFTEEEEKFLEKELEEVMNNFELLKNINLNNVEPTNYSIEFTNELRDDDAQPYEDEEYIKTRKNFDNGLIKV